MMDKCKRICCKAWDKVKSIWNKWVEWLFKGFYK